MCRVHGQLKWKTYSGYGGKASESMHPALISLSRHNTNGWIQPSEETRPKVWHLAALLEHRAVRGGRNTQSLSWVEWMVVMEKRWILNAMLILIFFFCLTHKVMVVTQVDTVVWSIVYYWCCTEHWLPTAFWWVYRERNRSHGIESIQETSLFNIFPHPHTHKHTHINQDTVCLLLPWNVQCSWASW